MVKASQLIPIFRQMLREHWTYEWGAARKGCVDCSGAFVYAYKLLGSTMYHGSNTMYRKWSKVRGKIGTVDLVPGMAVYKRRTDGQEPAEYKNDGIGNMYHVGLYVGSGIVLEAKGTKYGFVQSKLSEWTHASDLINTSYDAMEGEEVMTEPAIGQGMVTTLTGALNLRTVANPNAAIRAKLPKGAVVELLSDIQEGWYRVRFGGEEGFASAEFITKIGEGTEMVSVPRRLIMQLVAYLGDE